MQGMFNFSLAKTYELLTTQKVQAEDNGVQIKVRVLIYLAVLLFISGRSPWTVLTTIARVPGRWLRRVALHVRQDQAVREGPASASFQARVRVSKF
jgi:hypothetical protein